MLSPANLIQGIEADLPVLVKVPPVGTRHLRTKDLLDIALSHVLSRSSVHSNCRFFLTRDLSRERTINPPKMEEVKLKVLPRVYINVLVCGGFTACSSGHIDCLS